MRVQPSVSLSLSFRALPAKGRMTWLNGMLRLTGSALLRNAYLQGALERVSTQNATCPARRTPLGRGCGGRHRAPRGRGWTAAARQ